MFQPTIVVVGNGMVGYKFCEKLLARSLHFNIIVFGEELNTFTVHENQN